MVYTTPQIEIKEIKMTIIAISCTVGVYSLYIVEAFRSYRKGEINHRPKPWLKS